MEKSNSIRLRKDLHKQIKEIADKEGKKFSWVLEKAVINYLISKKVTVNESTK